MKKDRNEIPVLINLLSVVHYDGAFSYPVQFVAKGKLNIIEKNRALLSYTEILEDEDSGQTVSSDIVLDVQPDEVTMTRNSDSLINTMVFSRRQRFEGKYSTPYGDMDMAVSSRDVSSVIGPGKGSVHLKYEIEFQGAYASSNEIHLEYSADKLTS